MNDRMTSARLAEEWAHLRHRRLAVHRAANWHITERPPTSLDDVLAAVGAGGDRSRSADRRLRRLVTVAADDHLAARVVIQRMVPGLLAVSRKYRSSDDAFEDLLAHAWIAVRTYNPDRSPSNLAASLLSDTEWAAYRRHHRRQANAPRTAQLPTEYTVDAPRHPSDELAELLHDAREAGMPGDDLELIRLLADTTNTEQIATRLAVTSRTIRNRRARVTNALRQLALTG